MMNTNHKISLEVIRTHIIEQFAFLNTLSIQIQNDLEKINSHYDTLDEEINSSETIINDYFFHCHKYEELRSLYERQKLIISQLSNLEKLCSDIDMPDGKLRLHLTIAIKAATKTIHTIESFMPKDDFY